MTTQELWSRGSSPGQQSTSWTMSLSFLQLCSQSPPQYGPGIFYALRQDPIKNKYATMSLTSVSQEKIRETFVKNGLGIIGPALGERDGLESPDGSLRALPGLLCTKSYMPKLSQIRFAQLILIPALPNFWALHFRAFLAQITMCWFLRSWLVCFKANST